MTTLETPCFFGYRASIAVTLGVLSRTSRTEQAGPEIMERIPEDTFEILQDSNYKDSDQHSNFPASDFVISASIRISIIITATVTINIFI